MTLLMFAVTSLEDVLDRDAERMAAEIAERFKPAHVTPMRLTNGKSVPLTTQTTADSETVGAWWGQKMAEKHGRQEDT